MSEAHTDASQANAITINPLVLHRSNLPFMISLASPGPKGDESRTPLSN